MRNVAASAAQGEAVAQTPALGEFDASVPLLLLPFRIETRFGKGDQGDEIWIRVYPDQVSIDSHEDALTEQEVADGEAYWQAVRRVGPNPADPDLLKRPWRTLAEKYGAPRAAWIVLQMQPGNSDQRLAGQTPPDKPLEPPPEFRQYHTRQSSWTQPPVATVVPEFWHVVTITDGVASPPVTGSRVIPPLQVGPDPNASGFPSDIPVDEGMRWLVDFDAAVAVGMGIRIPISAAQMARGFDRILVYGIVATGPKEPGTELLARLLGHHHYTDGLAWLPRGAPTNNTPDAPSAFTRQDPGFEASYAVELGAPLAADPDSDGAIAASLLGLDPSVFDHIQYSDRHDLDSARQMATALWPATLGYFLTEIMAPGLSGDQIASARANFVERVRGGGHLPTIRTGMIPSGIQLAASLDLWDGSQAADPADAAIVKFVRTVKPLWMNSVATSPHVGGSEDPDVDLAGILGMDARSMTFRGRWILGGGFWWNWVNWADISPSVALDLWSSQIAPARQQLGLAGLGEWTPRLLSNAPQATGFPIGYPTVTDLPLSETSPLVADAVVGASKLNYIQWLAQASVSDLRANAYPAATPPDALLYRILRQSLLLEYYNQTSTAEVRAGRLPAEQIREQEILDVHEATLTRWDVLNRPSLDQPKLTWAEYLASLRTYQGTPYASLGDLLTSLNALSGLPTALLDRLLTETLDACSYRLDAWASAIPAGILGMRRSAEADEQKPAGLFLGGFAWVEDLRPAQDRQAIAGTEAEAVAALDRARTAITGRQLATVVQEPWLDNGGFVLAPSVNQARTAAILRSGFLSHRKSSPSGQPLDVDLTSSRTRAALWLLDGIRQGQSLAALLGYQFEQSLHAVGMDAYIQPFRDLYQLVDSQVTPSQPGEAVAPSSVVNGSALQLDWQSGKLPRTGAWPAGLPPAGGADRGLVAAALDGLNQSADGLSDLSLAESVHQLVQGNPVAAGGILNAVSRGERPPEPDVIKTPRGGFDLTHRVIALFAQAVGVAPTWAGIAEHPRAAAEPRANGWVSRLLPAPADVVCHLSYTVGGAAHSRTVSLEQLDIGPLDLLSMSLGSATPAAGELEQRISYAGLPPGASDAGIDYTLDPVADAGKITVPDAIFAADALRSLIAGARPLGPGDLVTPGSDPAAAGGSVDIAELAQRAQAAIYALTAARDAINAASSDAELRKALISASYFAVSGAIPASVDESGAALADRAASVLNELDKRGGQAAATHIATARVQDLLDVIDIVFAKTAVVCPLFTPPDVASIEQAFDASAALTAGDDDAPDRWLQQLTHVREGAARLDMILSLAEMLAGLARPGLTLGQLPFQAEDTWLALPVAPAGPRGRLTLAALVSGDYHAGDKFSGFMLDSWPERIPNRQESAGLVFHADEPKARAPRSMLLAVNTDRRRLWDDEAIVQILGETLDWAKARAVTPYTISSGGAILPALYFPFNFAGMTISLDLANVASLPTERS